jgi:hypothetical protein
MDFIAAKPLASVTGMSFDAAPSATVTTRLDDIGVDGAVIDRLLSAQECERLVQAAEASGGFAFWDATGDAERRSVRNADTLEFEDAELCATLYERLLPTITGTVTFAPDNEETFERELEGEWVAVGLNPHLLLNRYSGGGHFAPHADGSTLRDFNTRSLYTVLIYLNECHEGGATQLLSSLDGATMVRPCDGARVAKPEAVLTAVAPDRGRGLVYYHQVLHAGEPVGAQSCKYCLRTDIMYERRPPICTAPHDVRAYELVCEARAKEARGETMEALPLYMKAAKMSDDVAKACQLR